jgi:hypothetical protein
MGPDRELSWTEIKKNMTFKLREKVLGMEHPHTGKSRNNLAACLRAAGDEKALLN